MEKSEEKQPDGIWNALETKTQPESRKRTPMSSNALPIPHFDHLFPKAKGFSPPGQILFPQKDRSRSLPVVLTYHHPLYNRSAKSASEGRGVGIKRKERKSNPQSNTGQRSRRFQSWATIYARPRIEILDGISLDGTPGEIRESVYTVFEKHVWGSTRIGLVY